MTDNLQNMTESDGLLSLPGLALNGEFMADARITWEEGFLLRAPSPRDWPII